MYGLEEIMRACYSRKLVFNATHAKKYKFDEPCHRIHRQVDLFNWSVGHQLACILAPRKLMSDFDQNEPYYTFSRGNGCFYKVCQIPDMTWYWEALTGHTCTGTAVILLSRDVFMKGKLGIAAACAFENVFKSPFCVGIV